MATALHRVQVLLSPIPEAKLRVLAKSQRRSMSAMTAELVEAALQLPKYKSLVMRHRSSMVVQADPRQRIPQPQTIVHSDDFAVVSADGEVVHVFVKQGKQDPSNGGCANE